jgi:hypothetical protein
MSGGRRSSSPPYQALCYALIASWASFVCYPVPVQASDAKLLIIERAVARNLLDYVHSTERVAAGLGASWIECAGGVAAFLGAGSPLTTVKGAGPKITSEEFDNAEKFFRRCGVDRAIFELGPWILAETVKRLQERGYEAAGSENVMVREPPFATSLPLHSVVQLEPGEWPELMLRMHGAPNSGIWRDLAEASAVIPDTVRFAVLDDGDVEIACAELFSTAGVGLFANDATLEAARGRGAQTAAIHERMRIAAEAGLSLLAAEVAPGSTSERNYLRCGFSIGYARTHFVRTL